MTDIVPSRMQVIRKQEKEPRLKDFIRSGLVQPSNPVTCLVVARSVESPVIRALASFASELAERAADVRTIFALLGNGHCSDAVKLPWLTANNARWMRNGKLADAHEFLVLGRSACWIGDSMRRDPEKRDAFEAYETANQMAVGQAERCFARLWALSEPISRSWLREPSARSNEATTETVVGTDGNLPAGMGAPDPAMPTTPGATRH